MAALSVNTNYGAMVALQQLNKTNMSLEQTQSRINTGLKVAGAKDNGAIFAIAQDMRADISGLGVAQQSLDRAQSTTDVALAAGEAISDLLVEMKEKALSASDATLSASQRSAYSEDFEALRDQIAQITTNADFNGVNLIDGSTAEIAAIANADGSNSLTVAAEDLSLSGSIVTITSAQDISTVTEAAAALTSVSASLENLNEALARLGTASKRVEVHNTFVTAMRDSIENGVGNLVDADMARESARLQALQTKQQLGVQALSIANQAPTIINSLFQ
ncbi:MAG: flagellin [Hirschia sp.]|nr:flagellin [Hirschia sp.]MBF17669.1 flagellin [Hirschia sp.]|tara:strand:+ start:860 stop:1690 length:831 start_codon:yes stop_codon:yes gene_type:complete